MIGRAAGQALAQLAIELRAHKGRFVLNIAPFVIGGGCLVLLESLVASADRLMADEAGQAAAAVLTVRPVAPPPSQRARTRRELEQADAAMLASVPSLAGTVTSERETQVEVSLEGRRKSVRLTGADPRIASVHHLALADGRFFTELEFEAGARVAVVGAALGKQLPRPAAGGRPVLRINARLFMVIGVLVAKPSYTAEGPWAWDERIIIPHTSFRAGFQSPDQALGARAVSRITWRPEDAADATMVLARARQVVRGLIRTRHLGVDNFRIQEPDTEQQQLRLVAWIVTALLLSTAAVSFVVGGFTITNAALASVAARAREIGIKRALGASRRTIIRQLVLETALQALVGGAAGVALGVLLARLGTPILAARVPGWQLVIPAWSLAVAVLLALAMGTVAGVYPGWRAARLDPIESLRPE